ncbi:electron transfer protein with DM13 domain [SAR116 cluster alpha proteobacterium HIMB100]|nr:electron transfer protein with DM13 domain [SAR116 cluster alpha proteobacterium HIMB100]
MNTLIAFARQHIILFGAAKFLAGLAIGFAIGIYTLPILTAESGLSSTQLIQLKANAQETIRTGEFSKKNPGSDFLHWGEGTIHVTDSRIWLDGEVSPGPDYRLYLTKGQISSKQAFLEVKDQALQVAPIKAFQNFSVSVPEGLAVDDYDAVIIWCERFSAFITSASLN